MWRIPRPFSVAAMTGILAKAAACALMTSTLLTVADANARDRLAGSPALDLGWSPARGHLHRHAPDARPPVSRNSGEPGAPCATPPGCGRIVWSRLTLDTRQAQIVSATPAGRDLRVLTDPPEGASDLDPKWSPDGTRILFPREYDDGRVEIVVMDATGAHQHVVDFGCTDPCFSDQSPTWAPDGRHIAFTRVIGPFDGPNEGARSAALWVGRDDGTHPRRLSPLDIDAAFMEDVVAEWSPDGSYIQFLRGRSRPTIQYAVFRMRPDGTDVRQLTPWELDADEPDLSNASGRSEDLVVFETRSHAEEAQNIATVPAGCRPLAACARQIRYLTTNPPDGRTTSFNPAWSPDGSRIAFAEATFPDPDDARTDWYADIFTMDNHGRDRRLVSPGPEWNFRPNWGTDPSSARR